MVDSLHCLDRVVPERTSQVSRWSEVGNHKRCTHHTQQSSGTSEGTFAVSAGPGINYRAEQIRIEQVFCTRSEERVWKSVLTFGTQDLVLMGSGPPLRQGWVWLKRTCIFSGIQFTKHFIESIFVETNKVVCSDSNLILTRQTCGQSNRVAGSKRRALAFYFPMRVWYVILILIFRRKLDLECVNDFGTWIENAAAQCRLLI